MRISRRGVVVVFLLTLRGSTAVAQPACGQCEPAFGEALPVQCGSVRAMSGGVGEPPVRFDVRSGDAVFHTTEFPVLVQGCRSATPGSQFGCEKVFDLTLNLTGQQLGVLAQGGTVALSCGDGTTSITYGEAESFWFSTDCAIHVAGVPPTTQIRGTFSGTLIGPSTIDVTGCFCSEGGEPGPDPCEALAIDKTDDDHTWGKDPIIPYVTTVTGDGNDDLVLTETVPVGTIFDAAASTPGWSCPAGAEEDTTCSFPVGPLGAAEQRAATFAVRVKDGTDQRFAIYNQVSVGRATAAQRTHEGGDPLAEDCTDAGENLEQICSVTSNVGLVGCCFGHIVFNFMCFGVEFQPEAAALRGASARGALTAPVSALVLYRVRDRVFHPTPGGRRATELYYLHSADMIRAAMADPTLLDVARAGLAAWTPILEALATGHGDVATITPAQVGALDAFLDALRPLASPALRQALDRERALLDPASLGGLTASEGLGRLDDLSCTPALDLVSVRCRVDELMALVRALVPDAKLQRRLLGALRRAGEKAEAAQRLTDQGKARPASNALRKVSKTIGGFEKRLGSRRGLREVPGDAREVMLGTSGPLRADVETLRGG